MMERHVIELRGPVGGEGFCIRQIEDLPDGPVHAVIDSHGGDTVNAFAMYHKLREHGDPVTVEIITAGSAATLVSMAGDRRSIHGSGRFFLHRCWGALVGTANTLRESLLRMEETDQALAAVYAARSGLPVDQVLKLMNAETRMDPAQAVTLGFCHEVLGESVPVDGIVSLPHIALAAIAHEDRTLLPQARQLQAAARPLAEAAAPCLALGSQPPKVPTGQAAKVLAQFCEGERREAAIRQTPATRLRRAIKTGGKLLWPVRITWQCESCGATNFHPPAKDRLATPCTHCGATSEELHHD